MPHPHERVFGVEMFVCIVALIKTIYNVRFPVHLSSFARNSMCWKICSNGHTVEKLGKWAIFAFVMQTAFSCTEYCTANMNNHTHTRIWVSVTKQRQRASEKQCTRRLDVGISHMPRFKGILQYFFFLFLFFFLLLFYLWAKKKQQNYSTPINRRCVKHAHVPVQMVYTGKSSIVQTYVFIFFLAIRLRYQTFIDSLRPKSALLCFI